MTPAAPDVPLVAIVPFIIVAIGVPGLFGLLFYRATKRSPTEEGRTPIYSEWCGGRLNRLAYRGPLIRVALYDDILVLSSFERIELKLSAIERVAFERSRRSGTLFRAVTIHHNDRACRTPLVIASVDGSKLGGIIQAALDQTVT